MPSSQWDHKADRDILLAIIDEGQLKGIDWKNIAAKMKVKGYTFTHEACRQHFQKLRKESSTSSSSANVSPTTSTKAKTPGSRKRSKFTPSSSFNTSASHANQYANSNGIEYDDEEEEMESPSKRQKMKEAGGVKRESFEVKDVDVDSGYANRNGNEKRSYVEVEDDEYSEV